MIPIPVNEPLLGDRELSYVSECVRTGWISSAGRFIEEFEEKWAAYCGRRHGVAVSNGTVALQVAAACLGLKPGDEVIMYESASIYLSTQVMSRRWARFEF